MATHEDSARAFLRVGCGVVCLRRRRRGRAPQPAGGSCHHYVCADSYTIAVSHANCDGRPDRDTHVNPDPDAHADPYAAGYPNSDANCHSDSVADPYAVADRHSDSYLDPYAAGYPNSDANCHSDSVADPYAVADRHSDSYLDAYADCYPNRDANADRDADSMSDANRHPDARPGRARHLCRAV